MSKKEQIDQQGKAAAEAEAEADADTSPVDGAALSERARLARDERGAALRALAGRLAHQMRNPLAAVRAACSSLYTEIDDPEQRETLELTIKEIDRMIGFVSATVQTTPQDTEDPQAINVRAEVADVIDIIASGYGSTRAIELKVGDNLECTLPRDRFRVSIYSLLEHLISATSVQDIAVSATGADGTVRVSFDVNGASSNDVVLSTGMTAAVNGFQPVGLLVAERFARDLGGRLTRTYDGGDTQSVTLALPCSHV